MVAAIVMMAAGMISGCAPEDAQKELSDEQALEQVTIVMAVDAVALRNNIMADNPSFTRAEVDAETRQVMQNADERILQVLRKRVDGISGTNASVEKRKDGSFVCMAKLSADEKEHVVASLLSSAFLEFRLVHKDNAALVSKLLSARPAPEGFVKDDNGVGYIATEDYATLIRDPEYRRRLARFGCETLVSYEMMLQQRVADNVCIPHFVSKKRELTGVDLQSASVGRNATTKEFQVNIQLNKKGTLIFRQFTEKYCANGTQNPGLGRQLAIILDGVFYSAPVLQTPIPNGQAVISGNFAKTEAQRLCNLLNAGSLPVPLKIVNPQELQTPAETGAK